jgi:hypothetical protein
MDVDVYVDVYDCVITSNQLIYCIIYNVIVIVYYVKKQLDEFVIESFSCGVKMSIHFVDGCGRGCIG